MMEKLAVYLKSYPLATAHAYLSENDMQLTFAPLQKLYYGVARPLMPLFMRRWLQSRYTRGVKCETALHMGRFCGTA